MTVLGPIGRPFLPELTSDNREFWTSGSQNVLRIDHCDGCRRYLHPPVPICPFCGGDDVVATAVSGRGTVYSFTVNYQQWNPEMTPPYVLAVVELEEQRDVRLTTNIVGCDVDDVHIGMLVAVEFEAHGDVHLPLFRPVGA
jgi:uncharacterized protein